LNVLFFRLLLLAIGAAVVWVANSIWYKPFNIDHFFERVAWEYGQVHPEAFTRFLAPGVFGFNYFNRNLDDPSDATAQVLEEWAKKNQAMLRSYRPANQTEVQLISGQVLDWYFEEVELGKAFARYGYPFNPCDGIHLSLPDLMLRYHQVNDLKDAESYLQRLAKFDKRLEDAYNFADLQEERQLPCELRNRVKQQVQSLVVDQAVAKALLADFKAKIEQSGTSSIPLEAREELSSEAQLIIFQSVYPAYVRLAKRLDSLACGQERPAPDSVGQEAPVNADPYYAYQLHYHGTTPHDQSPDPDQLFRQGQVELDELRDSLRAVAQRLGYAGPDAVAWLRQKALPPSPAQADSLAQRVAYLERNLGIVFETAQGVRALVRPKSGLNQLASPLPDLYPITLEAKPAPATYEFALDSAAPARPYEWLALAARDIFPGYLYQKQVQAGLAALPTFRRAVNFTAFARGWQAYVLHLLAEQGFFGDDTQKLGLLHLQLVQQASLVADLGLHSQQWSRARATAYLRTHTALTAGEVAQLVDQLVVYPGQATAWHFGLATLLQQRELARRELGNQFELLEFHNAVLQSGSVPLPVLEQVVARYIMRVKHETQDKE
jgi:uncharacterized protein (DUF885 family)